MAKYYATGRLRKFPARKRRVIRKVKTGNYWSVSPRAMHMPLPSRMCLTLRAVDNVEVTYNATAGFDAFTYPLYFPGLWKDSAGTPSFAGGFLYVALMYSVAWVKKVKMTTRMMAISNATNSNINVVTMVCSENQAANMGTMTTLAEFQNETNQWLGRRHYLSTYTGGNSYAQDVRYVDVSKFTGMPKSQESRIFISSSQLITTPSGNEGVNLPNYVIAVNNPGGTGAILVRYEFVFDFDIELNQIQTLPQNTAGINPPTFSRRT